MIILVASVVPLVAFAGTTIGSISAIYVLIAGGTASIAGSRCADAGLVEDSTALITLTTLVTTTLITLTAVITFTAPVTFTMLTALPAGPLPGDHCCR